MLQTINLETDRLKPYLFPYSAKYPSVVRELSFRTWGALMLNQRLFIYETRANVEHFNLHLREADENPILEYMRVKQIIFHEDQLILLPRGHIAIWKTSDELIGVDLLLTAAFSVSTLNTDSRTATLLVPSLNETLEINF